MAISGATGMPAGLDPTPTRSAIRLAREILALAAGGRWPASRHITEAELVATFRVSRTPVRAALKLLAGHGIVQARPNQGFFLVRDSSTLDAFDLEPAPTKADVLYGQILRDRIAGTLPQDVTQPALASRYGASRTVLSQVLGRLSDDVLIARGAGRSWYFVPTLTDRTSVQASYEFRMAIEPAAILSDSYRLAPAPLHRLRDRHLAVLDRLTDLQTLRGETPVPLRPVVVGLDADFHQKIATLSNNAFLEASSRHQMSLRRLLEFSVQDQMDRVIVWMREHVTVIEALLDNDRSTAADKLREHLRKARERSSA